MLAFYITRPFLPSLLTGAIIAYLAYPLYKKTSAYIRNKSIASFIIAVFVALLLIVPVVVVLSIVSKEAYYTYTTLNQHNLGTNFLRIICKNEGLLCKSVNSFVGFLPKSDLDYYIQAAIEKITKFIIEDASKLVASLPSILLNFFVMLFVIYYLLKDGDRIVARIKNILPLKESHKQHVLEKFHNTTYAVFYGNISVAILQGILGGIGFMFLGIPSPILWGFVMILFALMPYFGTAIIWLPAALNQIFIGYLQNDNVFFIRGVVLIAYGVLIISNIDHFLKPKLIGMRADIHPILVLIGILGGLSLFGLIGLVLGPVMLALLMTFIDIYEEEKAELDKYF